MRFRVWDKLEKEYSKDNQFNLSMDGSLYYGNAKFDAGEVEFSTGIKDENNVEIFEGDIIKVKHGYIDKVMKHKSGTWLCDVYGEVLGNNPVIIGNIHENKELLEED